MSPSPAWSLTKLADHLVRKGMVEDIIHEDSGRFSVRRLLRAIESWKITAPGYLHLDGTDQETHEVEAFLIRRYIAWRNRHAQDQALRELLKRAKVA